MPSRVDSELPAALVARYRQRLPGRVAALADLLDQVAPGDVCDSAEAEAARTAAHHLRGTAATYGFKELGAAVADVDDVLTDALDSKGGPLGAASLYRLRALVRAARDGLGEGA